MVVVMVTMMRKTDCWKGMRAIWSPPCTLHQLPHEITAVKMMERMMMMVRECMMMTIEDVDDGVASVEAVTLQRGIVSQDPEKAFP